ncbi:hypothetical protein [Stenotrophomonas sp. NRRL B-14846]|uniref:hypothetical protein n=1 Tax=Stenotrophomonas sp. NRRL B-14846 TaxID=3162882 RepID=UPI003D2AD5A4
MKTTHRNSLLAALLVCLAPAAASATEAHLTPNSNGGSGAMPSGYSKLHFSLANGDWTGDLTLPQSPRQGDVVELSSSATMAANLDMASTTHGDLLNDLPVTAQTNIQLRWSAARNHWFVLGGTSARRVTLSQQGEATVPMSEHAITDVFTTSSKAIARVNLPEWAPDMAQLAFVNSQPHTVELRSAGKGMSCATEQVCAFLFNDNDGAWHARAAYARFQPIEVQLPEPSARIMDVVVGSVSEDVTTPSVLRLPTGALEGDLYTLSNPSGDHFTRLAPDNSNLSGYIKLPRNGITLRYDAATRTWRR